MDEEHVTNRCVCGWEVTGSLQEVVEATIEHGRRMHNMVATREGVIAALAAAVPSVEDEAASAG